MALEILILAWTGNKMWRVYTGLRDSNPTCDIWIGNDNTDRYK
jgi:hypothetical protein